MLPLSYIRENRHKSSEVRPLPSDKEPFLGHRHPPPLAFGRTSAETTRRHSPKLAMVEMVGSEHSELVEEGAHHGVRYKKNSLCLV